MSDSSERLNELLVKQIERLDGAADEAVDFAVEHAPDLVQQLLVWNATVSAIWFSIGVAAMAVTIVAYKAFWRHTADQFNEFDRPWIRFAGGMGALCTAVISVMVMASSLSWLKILIAPKLYLFEYAASLAK